MLIGIDVGGLADAALVAVVLAIVAAFVAASKWVVSQIGSGLRREVVDSDEMVAAVTRALKEELDSRPLTNGTGMRLVEGLEQHLALTDLRMDRIENRLKGAIARLDHHLVWEEDQKWSEHERLMAEVRTYLEEARGRS